MQENKIPVIIDCDPGADDALAILLALSSPKLEVKAITTLCGNGPCVQMAKNAGKVCALAGRFDIPVYAGANQPMEQELKFTTRYCGEDGLCESGLAEHNQLIRPESALEFLAKQTQPVTILAMAGLTNLAQLITQYPQAAEKIREIVFAGGYFGLNPKPDRAEWNVLVDPQAAQIVFESGVRMRCVGLDVTNRLQDGFVEQILENTAGKIHDFMDSCTKYNRKTGLSVYSILVDGMAAAAAIRPDIASFVPGRVQVFPQCRDAGLMRFEACEQGWILAAETFDYDAYLTMIREMMK